MKHKNIIIGFFLILIILGILLSVNNLKEVSQKTNTFTNQIYTLDGHIHIRDLVIKQPDEFYILDQNQNGIIFGDFKSDAQFGIGRTLQPNGGCKIDYMNYFKDGYSYSCLPNNFHRMDSDDILGRSYYGYSPATGYYYGNLIGRFGIIENGNLTGSFDDILNSFELPMFSAKIVSLDYDEFQKSIESVMNDVTNHFVIPKLLEHWERQKFPFSPREVQDIADAFADYMDYYKAMVSVNNVFILSQTLAPAAGSPTIVSGVHTEDGALFLKQPYLQNYHRLLSFSYFLESCGYDYVEDIVNNNSYVDVRKLKTDLSCGGKVRLKHGTILPF